MTAAASVENWEDTFTYHGGSYHVTREYHRWVVSDGRRTEGGRTLVEAFDALLGTPVRDDELLGLVVRVLSSCWTWLPASSLEQPRDGNEASAHSRSHDPGR
jgi:hypothetical protein